MGKMEIIRDEGIVLPSWVRVFSISYFCAVKSSSSHKCSQLTLTVLLGSSTNASDKAFSSDSFISAIFFDVRFPKAVFCEKLSGMSIFLAASFNWLVVIPIPDMNL